MDASVVPPKCRGTKISRKTNPWAWPVLFPAAQRIVTNQWTTSLEKKKKSLGFFAVQVCVCVHAMSHQCPKNDDVRGGQGGRGGVAAKNKLQKVLPMT